MVRWAAAAAALVGCAGALAACSSGGGDATPTATDTTTVVAGGVDPCELVSAEVASAELDVDLTTSSATTPTDGQRCDYVDDAGEVLLGIQVEFGHTPETYRSRVEAGGPIEALVSAPGDAIWSGERRILATLVDGAFIQVVQPGTSAPEAKAQARALRLLDALLAGLPSSGTGVAAVAPFDPAGRSFEDNVLARVEDGEWTLGEGLVATLKLFAGEVEAGEVLRVPELVSLEGTGVIEMARQYAESGGDAAARAELDRLLAHILFTPEQLRAMATRVPPSGGGSSQTPTTEERSSAPAAGRTLAQAGATTVEDCQRFYDQQIQPGVSECLLAHESTAAGIHFTIYEPAVTGVDTGWNTQFGVSAVSLLENVIDETVRQTFARLGSLPDEMVIVLSVGSKPSKNRPGSFQLFNAVPFDDGNACVVTAFRQAQDLFPEDFKQVVAHEIAHCFQNATFSDHQVVGRTWREEGLAEYLGAVAYPDNNYEYGWVGLLHENELETATVSANPKVSRAYENVAWFHFLRQTLGSDEAIFTLVRDGPTTDGADAQFSYLTSLPEIEALHHDFTLASTDGTIHDIAGGMTLPTDLPRLKFSPGPSVAETGSRYSAQIEPLSLARFEVKVPKGHAATVAVAGGTDATVSARPLDAPANWFMFGDVEDFQASCEEDTSFVVVASSARERTTVTLDVTDVGETDCDATGEAAPSAAHCLVGDWKLVLGPPFMMKKVPLELTPTMQAEMVFAGAKGDVTLVLREGGTFDLVISNFDETIEFSDHGIVTKSNGNGTGKWKTNGDRLSVVLTGRKFKTEVGGTIGGASVKPLNAPPTYTYLWNDGTFTCTDERFGFTFPDGMSVSYVRR